MYLQNTFVQIPVEEYDKLIELASKTQEKIEKEAERLNKKWQEKDIKDKALYIRNGWRDEIIRVETLTTSKEEFVIEYRDLIKSFLEDAIYERYGEIAPVPASEMRRKYEEEVKQSKKYFKGFVLNTILCIITLMLMSIIVILKTK